MPTHCEKVTLPYTPNQLFDLVSDVAAYPQFLPWCLAARVFEQDDTHLCADLVVGAKGLRESFTSLVTLDRPNSIVVECGGGALSDLKTEWRFDPAPGDSCVVTFMVDFSIKSKILSGLMTVFFDLALSKMVDAFRDRATKLYGDA